MNQVSVYGILYVNPHVHHTQLECKNCFSFYDETLPFYVVGHYWAYTIANLQVEQLFTSLQWYWKQEIKVHDKLMLLSSAN